MISGWSPSATQNTLDLHKAQDLQVAKYSSGFAMAHKMGLAKITPTATTVTKTLTWTFTAPQTAHTAYTETKSSDTGSVTASTSFNSATSSRLYSSSGYWTILKATGENTSETLSLGTVTNVADDWTQSVSDIGYGKYKNYEVTSSRTFQKFVANFSYNSSKTYYQITLPWHGPYKLEVYGASGTTIYGTPGIGGYTYGTYTIDKSESKILYVCVGGAGTYGGGTVASASYAGYNGGGYGQEGGGGATHIAQTLVGTGVLSAYSSTTNQNYVLVVAGGAGNADLGTGGNGGGGNSDGGDGVQGTGAGYGRGGTATKGGQGYGNTTPGNGSFGQGGSMSNGSGDSAAAGGGGWYGGGSSTAVGSGPGGGGSGHVNTSKITTYGGTTGGGTLNANGSAKISM